MAHRITPPSISEELLAETQRLWDKATKDALHDMIFEGFSIEEEEEDLWPTE